MEDRQRQFAQIASAISQFAGANSVSSDRNSRERNLNDGRSSTGSTSSGSSSVVSNNGGNAMAAAVAAAAVGNNPVWGDLNRAFQYGSHPGFPSGIPWPPAHQGKVSRGTEYHRLGSFGNYNDGVSDGRNAESRVEGRRVPSKGETKATPPLPTALGANMGSTLASLQQLVGIPNEEVYRTLIAQQYAATAFSMPPSSRSQISPIPQSSHSTVSSNQHHSSQVSRHQSVDHGQFQQYHAQLRGRNRVSPPLSSGSPPLMSSSPTPEDGGMNGEFTDNHHRQDHMSPIGQHSNLHKDRGLDANILQISQNLMPSKMSVSAVERSIHREQERDMHYVYENERQFTNSRLSDGIRSGSESESDQRSRHRRKQHQPRRQSVIYTSNAPSHSLGASMSADSSSDDSQECDLLMREAVVNHTSLGQRACSPNRLENPMSSMSSAMSHALSHPFLAPHLNPLERPLSNQSIAEKCESPHVNNIQSSNVEPVETLGAKGSNSPSCTQNTISTVQTSSDTAKDRGSPLIQNSEKQYVEKITENPQDKYVESLNARSPTLDYASSPGTKASIANYSKPIDIRIPPLESTNDHQQIVADSTASDKQKISGSSMEDHKMVNGDDKISSSDLEKEESIQAKNVNLNNVSPEMVNGEVNPSNMDVGMKSPDMSDDSSDPTKRRTRQKRPVSYVEDATDPVLETNDYITPLLSPTRKRGRRCRDKPESDFIQLHSDSFASGVSLRYDSDKNECSDQTKPIIEYSNNNNNKNDELYLSSTRLEENVSLDASFSPPLSTASSALPSDIYDFNDPDSDVLSRGRRGRGRGKRRGSPKKHGRATPEFTRSCVSPRSSQGCRSPKFFTNARSPDSSDKIKRVIEEKSSCNELQSESAEPIDNQKDMSSNHLDTHMDEIERKLAELHSEKVLLKNFNGSNITSPQDQKTNSDVLTTISPTKLANLREDISEQHKFAFGNAPIENSFDKVDLSCSLSENDKSFDSDVSVKRSRRGRPKGSRTRSRQSKDTTPLLKADCKEHVLPDLSYGEFIGMEQHVTVGVAEIMPQQKGKRGRKRKKAGSPCPEKVPDPLKNSPVPKKDSEKKDTISPLFPKIKVRKLETLCDLDSFPRCIDPEMDVKVDVPVKMTSDLLPIPHPSPSSKSLHQDVAPEQSDVAKIPVKESDGETLEDIAKFLEDTAPDGTTSKAQVVGETAIVANLPSTSDSTYRDSRPKRISRPPQDRTDGEMNDLYQLLNMEDEESEDEDYIPKDVEDLDSNLSDDRLTESEDSSDNSESDDSSPESCSKKQGKEITKENSLKNGKKKSSKEHKTKKWKVLDKIEFDKSKRKEEKSERRGPYIKISEDGDSDVIVNTPDDLRDCGKLTIPFHVEGEVKNYRVGYNSTLHPSYDAFTKDMTWYCAFCKMFSHQARLGDLFGPFFIDGLNLVHKVPPVILEGQLDLPTSASLFSEFLNSPRSKSRKTPKHDSENDYKKLDTWDPPLPLRFVPTATAARVLGRLQKPRTPDRPLSISRIGVSSPTQHSKMKNPKNSNHIIPETSSGNRPPGTECWMHESCIAWAPGVRVLNSKLIGLIEAVKEAQSSICCYCKESGATVGCLARGCNQITHIPCAQTRNWSLDSSNFFSHCPLHVPTKATTSDDKS